MQEVWHLANLWRDFFVSPTGHFASSLIARIGNQYRMHSSLRLEISNDEIDANARFLWARFSHLLARRNGICLCDNCLSFGLHICLSATDHQAARRALRGSLQPCLPWMVVMMIAWLIEQSSRASALSPSPFTCEAAVFTLFLSSKASWETTAVRYPSQVIKKVLDLTFV